MIKKIVPAFLILAILLAFTADVSLKGSWEYCGGVYNGKPEPASKDYTLRRQYDEAHYTALFIEKGAEPIPYEKGNYVLKPDTCLETQTFSAQPSKLLNVTLKYRYQIKNDTLTFSGILPNGTIVQEYWKRVK
ncbi:hypothetical protein IDJ75_06190 [Mucilaginibacter rigui]|uniref:Lipocalin-like domain-containing protein n=1 Tax=Mucilaginibacter rigui TaxID=534635 RepID=A0ABR7X487_9SPHI|nr:hypothetical protein [Mucilaginibacter rigui]MBD1384860.1 hypothetical protein [Mucilaginibacter rigui]